MTTSALTLDRSAHGSTSVSTEAVATVTSTEISNATIKSYRVFCLALLKEGKKEGVSEGDTSLLDRCSTIEDFKEFLNSNQFWIEQLQGSNISGIRLIGYLSKESRRGLREGEFSSLGNDLQVIPEEIGGLVSLQGLFIQQHSFLTSLPESLVSCKSLVTLELSDNELTRLPDLSGLTALQNVNLSDNHLQAVPGSAHWTALKSLYIANNQFETPPLLHTSVRLSIFQHANNPFSDLGKYLVKQVEAEMEQEEEQPRERSRSVVETVRARGHSLAGTIQGVFRHKTSSI